MCIFGQFLFIFICMTHSMPNTPLFSSLTQKTLDCFEKNRTVFFDTKENLFCLFEQFATKNYFRINYTYHKRDGMGYIRCVNAGAARLKEFSERKQHKSSKCSCKWWHFYFFECCFMLLCSQGASVLSPRKRSLYLSSLRKRSLYLSYKCVLY